MGRLLTHTGNLFCPFFHHFIRILFLLAPDIHLEGALLAPKFPLEYIFHGHGISFVGHGPSDKCALPGAEGEHPISLRGQTSDRIISPLLHGLSHQILPPMVSLDQVREAGRLVADLAGSYVII